ncbi:tyrosine-type recombinase/integrase [Streptomyces lonarensis]|uniref:Tyrosine-type recombinase/integrase n=1 Tax=Streptomyces lonarensis TaxID=700599 RepID=A0A7X6CXW1_9ACTN|nr:tyrosine-type recombinase/integrase [Streptomyces lonarensis]NJQ04582.1 tyrosine-type recombinase/integrase [Streptomyces lonarensis]
MRSGPPSCCTGGRPLELPPPPDRVPHDLGHSTATLLLEQGVELVVIKELLGHAHISVNATAYVRLRLQLDVVDTLRAELGSTENTQAARCDGDEPPPCAAVVRYVAVNYCCHPTQKPHQDASGEASFCLAHLTRTG